MEEKRAIGHLLEDSVHAQTKNHSLFICNSDLTGCPIFYLAPSPWAGLGWGPGWTCDLTFLFRFLLLFFFFLCILFWDVSVNIFSSLLILSSATSSLLMGPSRHTSFLLPCSAFSFDSFLEFPCLCLHYPSVFICCLLFPLEPLTY